MPKNNFIYRHPPVQTPSPYPKYKIQQNDNQKNDCLQIAISRITFTGMKPSRMILHRMTLGSMTLGSMTLGSMTLGRITVRKMKICSMSLS
jgi:hypothetical protein